MRLVLLLLLLVLEANCVIDFIVDSFKKYVDQNSDPCDNFYRHVCPLDGSVPNDLLSEFFDQIRNEFDQNSTKRAWDRFSIMDDYKVDASVSAEIPSLYLQLCENGVDTTLFLTQLHSIIGPKQCKEQFCYHFIREDPDCNRGTAQVESIVKDLLGSEDITEFIQTIGLLHSKIVDISAHIDYDVRDGIVESEQYLNEMKKLVVDWIKETSWVVSHGLVNSTISLVEPVRINDNYGADLKDLIEQFILIEIHYTTCKANYENRESAKLFCLAETAATLGNFEVDGSAWSLTDAFIDFPTIDLGFAFFYVAQHTEDAAGKLGFTGAAIGHELSHMLIKGGSSDFLTYFSENSKKCILNQFNSTCQTFMEDSCITFDGQVDDDGADTLGFQLAYSLLETFYGDSLNEIYEPLNVTHKQLFYYSLALSFCQGLPGKIGWRGNDILDEHASADIRVNAMIAPHPGFQEAFHCTDDSRMIRSSLESCIIYGRNAPNVKKHR
ncbi:unnamed protein product [Caenorhabditis sp. 36 PRJEB53466]|nr:unnamed protein product [Caenorhabditis sp. 36 PRJEB53466]